VAAALIRRERFRWDLLLRGREAGFEAGSLRVRCAVPGEERPSLIGCEASSWQRPAVQVLLELLLRVFRGCLRHVRCSFIPTGGERRRRTSCVRRSTRPGGGSHAQCLLAGVLGGTLPLLRPSFRQRPTPRTCRRTGTATCARPRPDRRRACPPRVGLRFFEGGDRPAAWRSGPARPRCSAHLSAADSLAVLPPLTRRD